jgi:hypothetical protein
MNKLQTLRQRLPLATGKARQRILDEIDREIVKTQRDLLLDDGFALIAEVAIVAAPRIARPDNQLPLL